MKTKEKQAARNDLALCNLSDLLRAEHIECLNARCVGGHRAALLVNRHNEWRLRKALDNSGLPLRMEIREDFCLVTPIN